jgi:hypothetical protein
MMRNFWATCGCVNALLALAATVVKPKGALSHCDPSLQSQQGRPPTAEAHATWTLLATRKRLAHKLAEAALANDTETSVQNAACSGVQNEKGGRFRHAPLLYDRSQRLRSHW